MNANYDDLLYDTYQRRHEASRQDSYMLHGNLPGQASLGEESLIYGFALLPHGRNAHGSSDNTIRKPFILYHHPSDEYWDDDTNSPILEKVEWQKIMVQLLVVPPVGIPIDQKQMVLNLTTQWIQQAHGSWQDKWDLFHNRLPPLSQALSTEVTL